MRKKSSRLQPNLHRNNKIPDRPRIPVTLVNDPDAIEINAVLINKDRTNPEINRMANDKTNPEKNRMANDKNHHQINHIRQDLRLVRIGQNLKMAAPDKQKRSQCL